MEPCLWNAFGRPFDGKQAYARNKQDWNEKAKVWFCDQCGFSVAWTKSKKTGKPYLCDVRAKVSKRHYREVYFDPSQPHFKTCDPSQRESRVSRRKEKWASRPDAK